MFQRHNRVWLTTAGWKLACATALAAHVKELTRWAENDWPAIIRRSESALSPNILCLGLAAPPDPHTGMKTRIPFLVSTEHIVRHDVPLAIISAEKALPAAWQNDFAELAEKVTDSGLEFRVYGSAAMQAITGLSYLTPASDIDLLFYPQTKGQLLAGVALLTSYATKLPLDGEIVFPSGRAVAWKEWVQAANNPAQPRVLAKGTFTLALASVADLCAELESPS